MSTRTVVAAGLLSINALFCHALTNYYVVPPPNAGILPPYTNWDMAATNIQDVITIALGGDTIFVTNGHYYLTTYINVNKGVIIRSFNNGITDPTNTIIDGNNYVGKAVTNRCISITTTATVDGLTFTNGDSSSAGGCSMTAGLLTNCIVIGNTVTNVANSTGGGISADYQSTVANCQIIANSSRSWGGGIYISGGAVLKNSLIGWNLTPVALGSGAGVGLGNTSTVFNCDIVSNNGYGGVYFIGRDSVVSNCVIRGQINGPGCVSWGSSTNNIYNIIANCQIINNYGSSPAGGYVSRNITYRNCLIANNRASGSVGALRIDTDATGTVESCTIVSNYAPSDGGIYAQNGSKCFFYNTIICSNRASGGASDMDLVDANATNLFTNCLCKTVTLPSAQGNIKTDPLFVDVNSGNYRLANGSPCINTGTIQNWMTNAFDLDGRHRLNVLSGLVDMGCYEYIPAGTMFICK